MGILYFLLSSAVNLKTALKMYVCVGGGVVLCPDLPPLYKNTSHIVLGPTLMTSFKLDYFRRDPVYLQSSSHSETIEA